MKFAVRALVWVSLVLLVLVVIAIPVANHIIDQHRNDILTGVSNAIGRDVLVSGDVRLAYTLPLELYLGDVSIRNTDWAAEHDLVSSRSVGVVLDLTDLLEKRIDIKLLELEDATINLEHNDEQGGNWLFSSSEGTTGGTRNSWEFEGLRWITLVDSRVNYKSGARNVELDVSKAEASISSQLPVSLSLVGKLNGDHFSLGVNGRSVAELLDATTGEFPLSVRIELGQVLLEADAKLDYPLGDSWSAQAVLKGASGAVVGRLLTLDLPGIEGYEFSARIEKRGKTISLSDFSGTVDLILDKQITADSGGFAFGPDGSTLELSGEYFGQPYALKGTGGALSALDESNSRWPIQVETELPGMTGNASGELDLSADHFSLTGQVSAHLVDPSLLLGPLPASVMTLMPLQISGHVNVVPGDIRIDGIESASKSNKISGSLRLTGLSDRPQIDLNINSRKLDLTHWFDPAPGASKQKDGQAVWRVPVKLAIPRAFDANIEWQVGRLIVPRLTMKNVSGKLVLQDGALVFPTLSATVFNDKLKMKGRLSNVDNVAAIDADISAGSLSLEDWFKLLQIDLPVQVKTGKSDLKVKGKFTTLETLFTNTDFTFSARNVEVVVSKKEAFLVDMGLEKLVLKSNAGKSLNVVAAGRFLDEPIRLDGTLGNLSTWLENKGRVTIDTTAKMVGIEAEAKGYVELPLVRKTANFDLRLSGTELGKFSKLVPRKIPPLGDFELRGTLKSNEKLFHLHGFAGQLKGSRMSGELRYDLAGPVANLDGNLKLSRIDIAGWIAEQAATKAESTPTSGEDSSGVRVLPNLSELKDINLDLDLEITQLFNGQKEIGSFLFRTRLSAGNLRVDPFNISFKTGGDVGGKLEIDSAARPAVASIELDGVDVNYGGLLQQLDQTEDVAGIFNFHVDARSSGVTTEDLVQNAKGSISTYGGKGHFGTQDLKATLTLENIASGMLPGVFEKRHRVELDCFAMQADIYDGTVRTDSAVMETDNLHVAMTGVYEILTRHLQALISPRKTSVSIFEIALPINLDGPINNPSITAGSQGSLNVLGILNLDLSQPGSLLGLLDPVQQLMRKLPEKDENVCVVALAYQDYQDEHKDEKSSVDLNELRKNIRDIETNEMDDE